MVYNVCSTRQLVMAIVPLPSRPRGLDFEGGRRNTKPLVCGLNAFTKGHTVPQISDPQGVKGP